MSENSKVENVFCTYCRKVLEKMNEIEQNYHFSCHSAITEFKDDTTGNQWYYLDSIHADFDDISCDADGNIVTLDLSNKGLTHIPEIDNLSTFKHLQEINITRNYLSRAPSWFFNLPSLKKVMFPGNGFSFSLLRDILRLNAHGLQVVSTGCGFNQQNQLKRLNLSWLEYSGTNISDIPSDIIEYFQPVEHVLLRSNRLRRLPDWIIGLKNLKELNVASNDLSEQEKVEFKSKNLVKVNIAENSFNYVPDWVLEQKNLQELDLSNNELFELPSQLFNMKKLQKLVITKHYVNETVLETVEQLGEKGVEIAFENYSRYFF